MTEAEAQKMVDEAVDKAVKPLNAALTAAIQDLTPQTYHKVAELPAWAQAPVKRLIEAGIITGDGVNEINLTDADLKTASMADKLWLAVVGSET